MLMFLISLARRAERELNKSTEELGTRQTSNRRLRSLAHSLDAVGRFVGLGPKLHESFDLL